METSSEELMVGESSPRGSAMLTRLPLLQPNIEPELEPVKKLGFCAEKEWAAAVASAGAIVLQVEIKQGLTQYEVNTEVCLLSGCWSIPYLNCSSVNVKFPVKHVVQ
jgi:hypothetical protein